MGPTHALLKEDGNVTTLFVSFAITGINGAVQGTHTLYIRTGAAVDWS